MFGLVIAAAALAAAEPAADSRSALEQLQQVYAQSCGDRAFGSYNDMCDQMRREIKAYRRTLARPGRAAPRTAASREPAPPLVPVPEAVESAAPLAPALADARPAGLAAVPATPSPSPR